MTDTKFCNGCEQTLDISQFSPKMRRGKLTVRSRCKQCESNAFKAYCKKNPEKRRETKRNWYAKHPKQAMRHYRRSFARRLGICPDALCDFFDQHDRVCDACGTPEEEIGSLHLDHNHDTNEIRGLICSKCNLAAGHLHDDPHKARKIADYLERPAILQPTSS